MKQKYKYFTIQQDSHELFEGKPVYRIYNNRSVGQIGIISYYKPWRQYVFSSSESCVFNTSCLRDIISFMEDLKGVITHE